MLILYEFRCNTTNNVFEKLAERGVDEAICACGNSANRMISPVRCKLDHTFPGAGMKWEKMHEREAKTGRA